MYGELAMGHLLVGHPVLCFKDTCKKDLKFTDIVSGSWEQLAYNHSG